MFELPWKSPKVVMNASRKSRGRWRNAAFADREGLTCYQTFYGIWPKACYDLTALTAILNGPVANAFVASRELDRHITKETLDVLPLPQLSDEQVRQLDLLVKEYLESVTSGSFFAIPTTRPTAQILADIDSLTIKAYRFAPADEKEVRDYLADSHGRFRRSHPKELGG